MDIFIHIGIWHWLALAFIFLILEMISGSGFLLCTAASAGIVAGIVAFFPSLAVKHQILIFAMGSFISCFTWWFYSRNHPREHSDAPFLNKRGMQYIGRTFTLTEPIGNQRGRIKVDDTVWQVEGVDLPTGAKVKVVGLVGTVFIVEKSE